MTRGTTDRETKLLIEELCPECKGVGCYYSPAWTEWNKTYAEIEKEVEAEATKRIGCTPPRPLVVSQAERKMHERGIEQPSGPEEPDCPTCEGSGRATRYVTILELADLIDAARAARRK